MGEFAEGACWPGIYLEVWWERGCGGGWKGEVGETKHVSL